MKKFLTVSLLTMSITGFANTTQEKCVASSYQAAVVGAIESMVESKNLSLDEELGLYQALAESSNYQMLFGKKIEDLCVRLDGLSK